MAMLIFGKESIADVLIPNLDSMAACITNLVPDTGFGTQVVEASLDAINVGIVLAAALLCCGRGLRQRAHESAMYIQDMCCKRKVAASVVSWRTRSAIAARRSGDQEEKLFMIDVFKGHAQRGNTDRMMQVLTEVEKDWLPRLDLSDYHCFIQCLAKGGDPVEAHMWLRRCTAAGLQPFHSTFNAVINAYIKKKQFERALQVADEMKCVGKDYDTATYNMVIDVWARKGDVHRAQSWMRKMLDERIQPNIIGFSTIMRACAEAGLLEDLEGWFETSQSYGFQLDLIGFRSVLRAFAKRDDAFNAAKWLDLMIEKGVQPGNIDFMEVFKPILKHGDIELAIRLMDQVRASGVQPPTVMINECIVLAVKAGQHCEAQTWAHELAARKVRLGEAATSAMVEAGLTVPALGMFNQEDPSRESVDARAEGNAIGFSVQASTAAREAAVGCNYIGVIKESNPYRYGFITCAATYEIFKHDVWFCQDENKEKLTKGQRVSFRLRVDDRGRPRACDMTLGR